MCIRDSPNPNPNPNPNQCAPCAECPNCPACALCVPRHSCPLRTPRDFVRLVLRLTAATSDAPPALRAVHNGLSLFGDAPVQLPASASRSPSPSSQR